MYSPLPDLDEAEFAELENLGKVSILLAPNHYHHRGIARHVERFPHANLACATGARPRLQKLTILISKGWAHFQLTCRQMSNSLSWKA